MSDPLNDKTCDNSCCPIESFIFSLPPKQFALLATLFGLILLDDLSTDQINVLGNFIVSIGQTMLTAVAQEQAQQNDNSQNNQILQEIENLKNQISLLKKDSGNPI